MYMLVKLLHEESSKITVHVRQENYKGLTNGFFSKLTSYGITGKTPNWITSFLSNRNQDLIINTLTKYIFTKLVGIEKIEIDIEKLDSWIKMVGRSHPDRDREREMDGISVTTMADTMRGLQDSDPGWTTVHGKRRGNFRNDRRERDYGHNGCNDDERGPQDSDPGWTTVHGNRRGNFRNDRCERDYGHNGCNDDERRPQDSDPGWTTVHGKRRGNFRNDRRERDYGHNGYPLNRERREETPRNSPMTVGKLFFQILQVLHHVGIASRQMSGNLPQAFQRKVTQLNKFVKPARPTDNVRAEIANANSAWAENMGKIMMSHYDCTLASLLKATGKLALNKEDFHSAKLTAIQWGKRASLAGNFRVRR